MTWTEAWSVNEEQQVPTYAATLERVGLREGECVLDVGCATGVFLRMCADRGAEVAGLDGSEAMIARARTRVPEADLRVADLQTLPFGDDAFDLVTGFGSFFYAGDVVSALTEAARVTRPGGAVVVQVFGRPERCDLEALKAQPGTWRPEIVEELMPIPVEESFDIAWAYEYADDATLLNAMFAGGAVAATGPDPAAVLDALAGCRQLDGSYRVANEWHVVVGRA